MDTYACDPDEFLQLTEAYRTRESYLALPLTELATIQPSPTSDDADPDLGFVVRHHGEVVGAAYRASGGHLAIGPQLHQEARALGACVGRDSKWIFDITCPQGVLGPFLEGYATEDQYYPGFVVGHHFEHVFALEPDAVTDLLEKLRTSERDASEMFHSCGAQVVVYVSDDDFELTGLLQEAEANEVGVLELCYIE